MDLKYNADGTVNLFDGYNFMPYFKGEAKTGPREEILYFGKGEVTSGSNHVGFRCAKSMN